MGNDTVSYARLKDLESGVVKNLSTRSSFVSVENIIGTTETDDTDRF